MRHYLLLLIASLFASSLLAGDGDEKYVNVRFGYSIAYPADILHPQGESDNGDGQKFLSEDGSALLLVYGANNVLEQSLEALYQEALQGGGEENPDRVVTYRTMKKDWFVVSGREAGNIFYQKTMMNGDQYVSFILEYPESQKAAYDPIVGTLAKSFRLTSR